MTRSHICVCMRNIIYIYIYILCCIRKLRVHAPVPNYIPHLQECRKCVSWTARARKIRINPTRLIKNNKQQTNATTATIERPLLGYKQRYIWRSHYIVLDESANGRGVRVSFRHAWLRSSSLQIARSLRKHVLPHTHWKKRQECRRYLERATYREKGTINNLS